VHRYFEVPELLPELGTAQGFGVADKAFPVHFPCVLHQLGEQFLVTEGGRYGLQRLGQDILVGLVGFYGGVMLFGE
jgi:hypothetical protein